MPELQFIDELKTVLLQRGEIVWIPSRRRIHAKRMKTKMDVYKETAELSDRALGRINQSR